MHTFLWNEPPEVSDRVVFAEFEWKCHCFWNLKKGEWDLKIFFFNCWNDFVLDSNISSGSRCMRVSETNHHRCLIGSFCWIWVKTSLFFKSKNGGVGSKNFFVEELKWFSLRFRSNICSISQSIRVFETSHHKCLIRSFLLNSRENITVFEI